MTEEEARDYCADHFSPAQNVKLERFVTLLLDENTRQNLVSPASCASIWSRHVVDSAQLSRHVPENAEDLADIGSGPGLPGLVLAIVGRWRVTLIEPRKRRTDFLSAVVDDLAIEFVSVRCGKAEGVSGTFDVITARAVASISNLVELTRHLRRPRTRILLPRGARGIEELDALPPQLRRLFHVEQSLTDPSSIIAIADGVPT